MHPYRGYPPSASGLGAHVCRLSLLLTALAAAPSSAQERLGFALDVHGEGGSLSGEQWIDVTLRNESFQYNNLGASGAAWLLFRHDERLRYGPGLRAYGNYAASSGRNFVFGPLFEGYGMAEYSLPAIEKFEAVFSGRVGFALLIPGGDFGNEIKRLQDQGVGVWSIPRTGWLAGLGAGTRRKMADRLWLRLDLQAQYQQLFLFATDERISLPTSAGTEDIRFRKGWTAGGLRLGLALGVELSL